MTRTTPNAREQLRTMRAENLAASEQLELIAAEHAKECLAWGAISGDMHTIRHGRLMIKALAKSAERLAAKFRSASARLPARREPSAGSRSYPTFTPGESTADYLARFATLNGQELGFQMLPYNLSAYLHPCTLYEGNALYFEPIEQPIDAQELAVNAFEPVAVVSGLTGQTLATVARHVAETLAESIEDRTGEHLPTASDYQAPYEITRARYCNTGSCVIKPRNTNGLRSRADRLAATFGKWSYRQRGYMVTLKNAMKFQQLYTQGWDANVMINGANGRTPPQTTAAKSEDHNQAAAASAETASATTAAVIEQASEAAPIATPDECEAGRELATVDACSESEASTTTCDASSAGSAPSTPQHGYASSRPHRATHDAHGQRIGQHVTGKSGTWAAVMFTDRSGAPSFEFEGPDGSRDVWSFATGCERMAALQAMARRVDDLAAHTPTTTPTDCPGYPTAAPDAHQQNRPVLDHADNMPRAVGNDAAPRTEPTTPDAPTVAELVTLLQSRGFHGVESRRCPGAVLLARKGSIYALNYSNTTQGHKALAKLRAAGIAATLRGNVIHVTGELSAADMAAQGPARSIVFKGNAKHHTDPAGRWEAWTENHVGGFVHLVFYVADAWRPTHYYHYKSADKAIEALQRFAREAESLAQQREDRKAQQRVDLNKPHGLAVGDVLRSSWGYDQTNTDYFEVTRLIGKRTVEVRQLAEHIEHSGHMSGVSAPIPGQYVSEPMRRQVDRHGAVNILRQTFGRATKLEPVATVAGVRCFAPSGWSSYA